LPERFATGCINRQQTGIGRASEQFAIRKGHTTINLEHILLLWLVDIAPAYCTVRRINR
jgi:hypothetical protein